MNCDIITRRERIIANMVENSAALFFSAPEAVRSNDTHYPYRQNSDFWYLTDFTEPESVLVLIKAANNQYQTILFNRTKDPLAETWTGYRLGQEAALLQVHVDKAYPIEQIMTHLPNLINGKQAIYHASQQYQYADDIINNIMAILRQGTRKHYRAPQSIIDWRPIVHEMRLFKSAYELEVMHKAGKITAQGHLRAMQACKPGMYEYQLESEILHEFNQHGARFPSYNTIVGGGNNGCILHYENNSEPLKDGDLVLIDAGCEYQYYAGDITRTFPINGKFTLAQREIYDLVLKAQYKAIELFKPGISIQEVNEHVVQIMVEGLVKLHIMQGDIRELIAQKAYSQFYMHGLGHWLGIDVHDVGDYKTPSRERKLEPGMVLTVEPGLYINQDADVPVQYRGIGIRIEDNIVITQTGNKVLTSDVPKAADEIEKLMCQASS
ncbi:Xaa-Pro aminopeptidase [Orbus hercynius]|uniref:Xaa-Pro aminopeptidase n=1 Tax=Orbus hercynius TaxID=593135 RepID=A0A495RC81_9GAMM|nr:Xaa-Pro aminopeptidase [Orbus hercynius]RKS85035.1 Xaa-Pro aminopeptidase [Orbus hercynius]